MLEQHIVFESDGTESCEYWTCHGVMGIGTEAINDVVIIPDVDHWDLRVRHTKESLREPHGIPVQVPGLELVMHLRRKLMSPFVVRILHFSPFAKVRRLNGDGIAV